MSREVEGLLIIGLPLGMSRVVEGLFLFPRLNLLLLMGGFSPSGLTGARASGGLTGGLLKINLEVIIN